MSAVVSEIRPRAFDEYLGPAHVNSVSAREVIVTLPEGVTAPALLAFSLPYTPAIGDVLLVIGRAGKYYAIGVLQGSGQTDLTFAGNVQLRAVDGKVCVAGDRGVEIRGSEIHLHAATLHTIAREAFHTFGSLYQRVTSLLRTHAEEVQVLVDKGTYTQAQSATVLADEAVTLKGREIHVG
jgi:Protein of unknown function (DUF3540)